MAMSRFQTLLAASLLTACPARGEPSPPLPSQAALVEALDNVIALDRPGQDGYATVWDGNKYVQCRHMPDGALRCEASGSLMQPSLARVLTPAKLARLGELGWTLDPHFGNYVQTFPGGRPVGMVAGEILTLLMEVYGVDPGTTGILTDWVKSERCPPRNGPKQNLAGMVSAAPAMAATAVHDCSFTPPSELLHQPAARSAQDLIDTYGARTTGEVARLRVNLLRRVHLILDTDVGYVQCAPEPVPPSIYCEAASADSWTVLASVLTPERLARLHALGFADPGRSQNYEKAYPLDTADNAAIARQLLTVLYEVYGYDGLQKLRFMTE